MKKICPSCGVDAADDDAFCAKCGAKLVPSAPNPPESFSTLEQPEQKPTVPVERRAEPSADEKTVPFWNRPLELDPKKLGERIKPGLKRIGERIRPGLKKMGEWIKPGLKKPGEWIGIGLVCALLLWFVYIPASVLWAYAWPDLRDDALWSFRGSRANGVRATGFTWGGDPAVLMTVKHYEGLAKDYYFVAWDEEHERYVAVRCDETTFQRIKSEESFRLKGVVRTLHKEIAEDFKRYGKDLSWEPTLVLPGKCIDMTGMKGVGCLFLALALVILPFCCEAGYKFWKKNREERRTARRCSNCGIRLDDNAKFCSSCGTPAPIERSPDPTEEESLRSSDDGNSLPKPLLYFLGGIAAFAFLSIYFVFYQRYWEIGWMKLSPDYSAHSTKYDKQNIPNGVVELGNGTMMVTGSGPRISDEDMEKLFKNLKNGGISRSGVINQQADDDDLEDDDDDWEDDEEDEEELDDDDWEDDEEDEEETDDDDLEDDEEDVESVPEQSGKAELLGGINFFGFRIGMSRKDAEALAKRYGIQGGVDLTGDPVYIMEFNPLAVLRLARRDVPLDKLLQQAVTIEELLQAVADEVGELHFPGRGGFAAYDRWTIDGFYLSFITDPQSLAEGTVLMGDSSGRVRQLSENNSQKTKHP